MTREKKKEGIINLEGIVVASKLLIEGGINCQSASVHSVIRDKKGKDYYLTTHVGDDDYSSSTNSFFAEALRDRLLGHQGKRVRVKVEEEEKSPLSPSISRYTTVSEYQFLEDVPQ